MLYTEHPAATNKQRYECTHAHTTVTAKKQHQHDNDNNNNGEASNVSSKLILLLLLLLTRKAAVRRNACAQAHHHNPASGKRRNATGTSHRHLPLASFLSTCTHTACTPSAIKHAHDVHTHIIATQLLWQVEETPAQLPTYAAESINTTHKSKQHTPPCHKHACAITLRCVAVLVAAF